MENIERKKEQLTFVDLEKRHRSVTSLQERLDAASPIAIDCSIYRVPKKLRRLNEEAYTPRVVSIGPIHHGTKGLEAMEKHKLVYLKRYLEWTNMTLDGAMSFVESKKTGVLSFYDAGTIEIEEDKFVEIVLLDATFVVVYLMEKYYGFSNDDYLSSKASLANEIRRDLTLLENQLPLFILQDIYGQVVDPKLANRSFIADFIQFHHNSSFRGYFDFTMARVVGSEAKHIVDLLSIIYLPSSESRTSPKGDGWSWIPYPKTLTELCEAGITLKAAPYRTPTLDIQFSNGVLEFPPICLNAYSESFLRNLLAYEDYHFNQDKKFLTDYISIMDRLVDTPNDVELLVRHGILDNWLGDYQNVCTLYANLRKEATSFNKYFYYRRLCEDLDDYCKVTTHRWRATLRHDYFNNPWMIISFFAALLLLLLTMAQTISSIISLK